MDISALTLFDGYRAVLAISGLISIGYSIRRGYLMYHQFQEYPEFFKKGAKRGVVGSIKSFVRKEKWELVQIIILLVILCGLYWVAWNL